MIPCNDFLITELNNQELYHHGVLGQQWGVRRYQNRDGSLTAEGRVHYGYNEKNWRIHKKWISKV